MEVLAVKRRFGIIGTSLLLDRAISRAIRVSSTDLSVLIEGESGVGKEVFSHIIHQLSRRKHNKFIAVNCGAIPEGTINSELFGHEKGAFTGASDKRVGYFEAVDGGTIFLDEIGEMPLQTQAFLLRILESGEFLRVGSSKVQKTDVRVIAATNVDLLERIDKGKFREDLYYRLNTVSINIPALRERKEDIPVLFRKFATDFAEAQQIQSVRLDEDALSLLKNTNFKGNIRQLKNIAEQASVMTEKRELNREDLMEFLPDYRRQLPVRSEGFSDSSSGVSDREVIFKFLADIKKDVNDLKRRVNTISEDGALPYNDNMIPDNPPTRELIIEPLQNDNNVHEVKERDFSNSTEVDYVEETLSIEEMEKRLIKKALLKHKGRRKEAAIDLEISERTLYRKIKQFNLEE